MKKIIYTIIVFLLVCAYRPVHASENDIFSEDDLFADDDIFVETEDLSDDTIATETEKSSFGLTGSVYFTNRYSARRSDYILKSPFSDDDDTYAGNVTANLLADARYKAGIKAFANIDLIYYSQGINTSDSDQREYTEELLQELFLDVNINRRIYFRLGKQFFKWGRNYFWNPTDLINIEKKNFLDLDSNLEGTRGIKMHIPFGTKYNIYGYANLEDIDTFQDIAWSAKFEFLLSNTEMGLSMWYQNGFKPVYGFDFSTRLFRTDLRGEISLSHGEDENRLVCSTDNVGNMSYEMAPGKDEWIPRISIGFSKSYNLFDINDRLSIIGEFYYNQAGLSDNAFADSTYILSLIKNGLYEAHHVSTYYGALFTTLRQFIISDMSLSFNTIASLTDSSGILSVTLLYSPLYDFYIELSSSYFLGDGKDEYTFTGSHSTTRLEFRYDF